MNRVPGIQAVYWNPVPCKKQVKLLLNGSSLTDLALLPFYNLDCKFIWPSTKMSWDRKRLGEKETWGQKNAYKAELTNEAKAVAESWKGHKKLMSRAPQGAPCFQKSSSRGISAATVLCVCDWAVTLSSVHSVMAVVILAIMLTCRAGPPLFIPCICNHLHPDWGTTY